MLRFFRQLRQKLIKENNARSYIYYAIGELLLVVVGILIALQINNWNENRIERTQELKLLVQLRSDLSTNQQKVTDMLARLEYSRTSTDSLLRSFRTKRRVGSFRIHASLIHRRFFFTPATSGYAQLSSSLGTLIQNDSLRNGIVQLYEGEFEEILNLENMLSNHLDQNLNPQSNKLFEIEIGLEFTIADFDENSIDIYKPIDFEALINNVEYSNTVLNQKRMYDIQINQLSKTNEAITGILSLLENEIINLEN